MGYEIEIHLGLQTGHCALNTIDVVFQRYGASFTTRHQLSAQADDVYANAPLLDIARQELVPLLQDALRTALPEYMLPSAFVLLSTLPLTVNGKLDRSQLPAPQIIAADSANATVAPRTALETTVAEIWRDVLGVEQLGIHNNFFDLGGHSLTAIQIVSRIRTAVTPAFTIKSLFANPTVAEAAEHLATLRAIQTMQTTAHTNGTATETLTL